MSQLIKEINGKYYQEAEVVMLATDKKIKSINDIVLSVYNDLHIFTKNDSQEYGKTTKQQHLYIVSNEDIKEGDWVLDSFGIHKAIKSEDLICRVGVNNSTVYFATDVKKIIATTDWNNLSQTSRNEIAKPSDSFIKKYIEEYNKGNVITKVLVEYVTYYGDEMVSYDMFPKILYKLKIDSGNVITLKKVEPELYTREQLEQYIMDIYRDIYPDRHWENKAWDWIKQNL